MQDYSASTWHEIAKNRNFENRTSVNVYAAIVLCDFINFQYFIFGYRFIFCINTRRGRLQKHSGDGQPVLHQEPQKPTLTVHVPPFVPIVSKFYF